MADSNVYSYERIQIVMANRLVAACTMIEYGIDTDSKQIHVLGQRDPYATIQSAATYKGKIGLMYEEYDALQDTIPAGMAITNVAPFEILGTRVDTTGRLRTDKLKKVTIKGFNKSYKGGETAHDVELELNIGGIDFNV